MRLKRGKKRLRQLVKGGTTRLVSPRQLREIEKSTASSDGILRQRSKELQLPDALVEASDTSPSRILPGPIMMTILAVSLILISIIAWLVSRMPE